MGFHRRHINDQIIVASAQGEFFSFQQMMTNADDYIMQGDFVGCFWEFFYYEKDAREHIWHILRAEETERERLIPIVCKCWEVVTNANNKEEQLDGINNYLDLAETIGNESNLHIVELVKVLRNKIKDIKWKIQD